MNNLITRTATLVVAGVLTAAAIQAQGVCMRAEIPFHFVVGEKTLSPGTYIVRSDAESRQFELLGPNARVVLLPMASSPVRGESKARNGLLVFNTYGNVHILRKVWRPGEWRGQLLPAPRLEKELARAATAAGTQIAAVPALAR